MTVTATDRTDSRVGEILHAAGLADTAQWRDAEQPVDVLLVENGQGPIGFLSWYTALEYGVVEHLVIRPERRGPLAPIFALVRAFKAGLRRTGLREALVPLCVPADERMTVLLRRFGLTPYRGDCDYAWWRGRLDAQ